MKIELRIVECENGLMIYQQSVMTMGLQGRTWICEDEDKLAPLIKRILEELHNEIVIKQPAY
jgi:hypothetical protein